MSIKTFSFLLLALSAAIAGALTPQEPEVASNVYPPAVAQTQAQAQPITMQMPDGKVGLNHAHGW